MPTFTVTTTADTGAGSLRDAITQANLASGPSDIVFDAALAGSTIALTAPLPSPTRVLTLDATAAAGLQIGLTGGATQIFSSSSWPVGFKNLTLLGSATFTNGLNVVAGELVVAAAGTFRGPATLAAGADLVFHAATDETWQNHFNIAAISQYAVQGAGRIVKTGPGWTTVALAQNTGGVSVEAGVLELGNTFVPYALAGSAFIAQDAWLVLNTAGNSTLASAIDGPGWLQKQGSGTLTLSGPLTGTPSLAVVAGAVRLATADAGLGSVELVGTRLDADGDLALSGALIGGSADIVVVAGDADLGEVSAFGGIASAGGTLRARLDGDGTLLSGGLDAQGELTLELAAATNYIGANLQSDVRVVLTGLHASLDASVQAPELVIASAGVTFDGVDLDAALTIAQSGARLGGEGTLQDLRIESGAVLAPGNSPGVLNTGDLTLQAGATLEAELAGTGEGEFDQLVVAGTVNVTGATLTVLAIDGYGPALGDSFVLIDNDGTDAVTGTFADLADGAAFTVGGQRFVIDYQGGDGNDVTLTAEAAPPPPAPAPETSPAGLNLVGTPLADTLTGTPYDDTFQGLAGRDTLQLRGGQDRADGGAGIDTAVFSGARGSYTVQRVDGDSFLVTGIDGSSARLDGIERLMFSDVTLAMDLSAQQAQIARLYAAALDRAPDEAGLEFYVDALAQGWTLQRMAEAFLSSPEFQAAYGGTDDREFLVRLYDNAFGRAPDAAGLQYQLNVLDGTPGLLGRTLMLASFVEAPETQTMLVGLADEGVALYA